MFNILIRIFKEILIFLIFKKLNFLDFCKFFELWQKLSSKNYRIKISNISIRISEEIYFFFFKK